MNAENTSMPIQAPLQPAYRKKYFTPARIGRMVVFTILLLGAVIMFAPFAFLISSSLKVETQVFQLPIQWIPNPVRWMNYVDALTQKPFLRYFTNTMIIVLLNQIAVLVTSSIWATVLPG